VTRRERAGARCSRTHPMGTTRPAPAEPLSAAARPSRADGLIRLSGRNPRRAGEHPINHHVTGANAPRGPR
jgi:hypothetical protein